MSKKSNDNGRAFEYAMLHSIKDIAAGHVKVVVDEAAGYNAAKKAFETLTEGEKELYGKAAHAGAYKVVFCEPHILYGESESLNLRLQTDRQAIDGDVRDLIIARQPLDWEVGLSLKHNHFAVRHNRLSPTIDFGKSWYGSPCSQQYFNEVNAVFDKLKEYKESNTKFADIPDKDSAIYLPVLNAFKDEILRKAETDRKLPKKLVEYMLGRFDFYKVISEDKLQLTEVQTYNMRGTLNKPTPVKKSVVVIPRVKLPDRIISFDFKPRSSTTLEMYLSNGWQFSFRIHNADRIATPSLKFDIQIMGYPHGVMTFNCFWNCEL